MKSVTHNANPRPCANKERRRSRGNRKSCKSHPCPRALFRLCPHALPLSLYSVPAQMLFPIAVSLSPCPISLSLSHPCPCPCALSHLCGLSPCPDALCVSHPISVSLSPYSSHFCVLVPLLCPVSLPACFPIFASLSHLCPCPPCLVPCGSVPMHCPHALSHLCALVPCPHAWLLPHWPPLDYPC